MNKLICLLPLAAAGLSSCAADPEPLPPPAPAPVVEHHYHTQRVYVPVRRSWAPADSAENFRAVERPGSYSQ